MSVETAKQLRPFGGRVLIVESVLDEEQRESGLIVPLTHQERETFKRGVIAEVDDDRAANGGIPRDFFGGHLERGQVVYFLVNMAHKIGENYVIDPQHIIAYEVDAE